MAENRHSSGVKTKTAARKSGLLQRPLAPHLRNIKRKGLIFALLPRSHIHFIMWAKME
jgi:predicted acetyltransferase